MKTLDDLLRNARKIQHGLLDEIERIIYSNSQEIEALNIDAFQSGEGSDGGKLIHLENDKYKGRYTFTTELIAQDEPTIFPKKTGSLYNFAWGGDFLSNFQLEVSNDLTKIEFFSTGTGSGDKAEFFRDYKNLFGLDQINADIMRYKIILPKLQDYVHKNL